MTPTNYNPAAFNWSYLLGQAATIGLKIIGAILIFVIGYFVVSFLAKIIDKVLHRVGFDRMIERGGIKQAMQGSGYDASDLLSKILFYTMMIFVVAFALNTFGPNPISDIFSRFIAFFPNIIVAIVIIIAAAAIGSIVRDLVRGAIGGLSYGRTVATAAYVGILVLGAFMALTQLNIATAIIVGLWYAVLALTVGVGIVAIGGGGIKPMEERWRRTLDKADQELPRVASEMQQGQQTYAQPSRYSNQPGVVYPQNLPPQG
jgi:hypothetical protein